jgi:hypothetical protein
MTSTIVTLNITMKNSKHNDPQQNDTHNFEAQNKEKQHELSA